MRVLVLGAAGFIGGHVVKALCGGRSLRLAGTAPKTLGELVLADSRPVPPIAVPEGIAIRIQQGDVRDPAFLKTLFDEEFDCVFHLAATLTLDAEMDFAQGIEVNVHALIRVLEHCRLQHRAPALMFASSISAFGGVLPDAVDDGVAQTPETSYGSHKAIAELLISDYSRRGFLDGRVLRLPIVLTHPGPASASVSDRIAALIREPLNGRDAVCPLDPRTRFPVASARSVVKAMLALLAPPADAFGATRALNLPSLTVTPAAIEAAVLRVGDVGRGLGAIAWRQDEQVQRIVQAWPREFTSRRARELGLAGDASLDAIVTAYVEDHLSHA
jgi:nucleoside-diphosphate-sugar epimerase